MDLKKKFSTKHIKNKQRKAITIFWKVQNFFFKIYATEISKFYFNPLIVRIIIKQNNIFVSCYSKKKTIHSKSAGLYKIKISRKKLKLNSITFIRKCFKTLKLKNFYNKIILYLIAPKNLRKQILKKCIVHFQKTPIILGINPKKCFNGCRAKKMRRKKFKKFRILK